LLEQLRAWFVARPELKMPPVLAVVTHIDLLSPAMEWAPPYSWQKPKRPKEQNIHDALAAVRDQLGEYLADIVPVCTAAGKVYGVEDWLLPAVTQRVSEALGVALLRVLRAERDIGKIRKVFDQLAASGREAARILWQGLLK
jgi:predicted GTPase